MLICKMVNVDVEIDIDVDDVVAFIRHAKPNDIDVIKNALKEKANLPSDDYLYRLYRAYDYHGTQALIEELEKQAIRLGYVV